MAADFDATSVATPGTSTLSWTHTPAGTPAGVVVLIVQTGGGDHVTGVTYGGVAMGRVARASDTADELGEVYAYFIDGDSIAAGAQTVVVSVDDSTEKAAVAATVTSDTGNAAVDVVGTTEEDLVAAGDAKVDLTTSETAVLFGAAFFGGGAPATINPDAAQESPTEIIEYDFGVQMASFVRSTSSVAAGPVTAGWAVTGVDDWASVGVAIIEAASVGDAGSTGSIVQGLPSLSQAAAGKIDVRGTSSQTLPSVAQSASSSSDAIGVVAQTLPAMVQAAAGSALVGGDGASVLPSVGKYWRDDVAYIANVVLTGVDAGNSDNGLLYGTLDQVMPGLYNITLFADAGFSTPVAEGVDFFGPQAITGIGGSGISGTIEIVALPDFLEFNSFTTWPWSATAKVIAGGDGASLLPSVRQSALASVLVQGTLTSILPAVRQAAAQTIGTGEPRMVCVEALDVFHPTAEKHQVFSPALYGDVFTPQTEAAQGGCHP